MPTLLYDKSPQENDTEGMNRYISSEVYSVRFLWLVETMTLVKLLFAQGC